MKYVRRRANRYEFRFPLPDDLAGKAVPEHWPEHLGALVNPRTNRFKTEVIRSLSTNEGKAADRRALTHIAELHSLVDEARRSLRDGPRGHLSRSDIEALVRAHEVDLLAHDEATRKRGLGFQEGYRLERPDGRGMTVEDRDIYRFIVDHRENRAAAARMQPDQYIRRSVDEALRKRGVTLAADDPARREAASIRPATSRAPVQAH
jgi:hypothetical protein